MASSHFSLVRFSFVCTFLAVQLFAVIISIFIVVPVVDVFHSVCLTLEFILAGIVFHFRCFWVQGLLFCGAAAVCYLMSVCGSPPCLFVDFASVSLPLILLAVCHTVFHAAAVCSGCLACPWSTLSVFVQNSVHTSCLWTLMLFMPFRSTSSWSSSCSSLHFSHFFRFSMFIFCLKIFASSFVVQTSTCQLSFSQCSQFFIQQFFACFRFSVSSFLTCFRSQALQFSIRANLRFLISFPIFRNLLFFIFESCWLQFSAAVLAADARFGENSWFILGSIRSVAR